MKRSVVLLVLVGTFGAGPAAAQITTGSIRVRAWDAQGGVLPGATVTISSPVLMGDITSVTGSQGVYRAPFLAPGTYTVKVELGGFQAAVYEGVIVNASATTTVGVRLAVAGINEGTAVIGQSPVVDTTSTNVSTLVSSDLLQRTPGGRDIWNLLEYKAPALVSSRVDVGGSESGLQAGFVAKGTPHGQNTQAINGANVSDPEAIGFADLYYDFDGFEEVRVSTGAHSIEVGTPGVYVNMVTKSATDRYQGQVSFYYQGDGAQSNNITPDLESKGVQKAGVDYLSDATAQLGGPLVKERLRFFTSWRDWRVHRFVTGFVDDRGAPVVESTDMFSWLVNTTYQATTNHRFAGFWTRQYYDKPQRGASAQNTPLSNWQEEDVFDVYQASWNGVLRSNVFADARISWVDAFVPLSIKDEAKARGLQSTLEVSTGVVTGSSSLQHIFNRHRLEAIGGLSYYKDRLLRARHELRIGFDLAYMPNSWEPSAIDQLNLTILNGQPFTVTLYNTPLEVKRNVDQQAFLVGDTITIPRWTINAGVRLERTRGSLPAQSSQPSQWFPNAQRQFSRINNAPDWTNVSPRVGVVWDITGNGKTAFKVNYARYNYRISTGLPDAVNPNGLSGEVYVWNDRNSDLRFQTGEAGAFLGGFGALLTSLDPYIWQPYSEEYTAALERELRPDFRLSAIFTHRGDRHLLGQWNPGAIWRAASIPDPLTGNTVTVFDQDPATFANNRFVVTNSDSLNIQYRGLDLVAQKRFSNRWQLLASYTYSRSTQNQVADLFGTAIPSVDPNDQVNAAGPTFWDRPHLFKTSATCVLPFEIHVSGNLRAQSGQPFSRQIQVSLSQGAVTVNAEPRGSQRYPSVTTIDVRASKVFRFPDNRNLELMIDVYNLANGNTVLSQNELTGARYRFPLQILAPRIARFGAKFVF